MTTELQFLVFTMKKTKQLFKAISSIHGNLM